MTDIELLELAALAAGIEYNAEASKPHPVSKVFWGLWLVIHGEPSEYQRRNWNPLTDDGDRYRLAKQLDIRIHFGAGYITYVVSGISRVLRWPEDVADVAYAIVSAAAEIGSSMKGQK